MAANIWVGDRIGKVACRTVRYSASARLSENSDGPASASCSAALLPSAHAPSAAILNQPGLSFTAVVSATASAACWCSCHGSAVSEEPCTLLPQPEDDSALGPTVAESATNQQHHARIGGTVVRPGC